jgi:hypothetical protein
MEKKFRLIKDFDSHLSYDAIQRYKQNNPNPGEKAQILSHISSCLECREKVVSLDDLERCAKNIREWLMGQEEQPYHPQEEELVDYVDQVCDDNTRDLIDLHCEECSDCQYLLSDLIASLK